MKKLIHIIVVVIVFIGLPCIYFYPAYQGKKLASSDLIQFQGMSKSVIDYRNRTGLEALWADNMFAGMPAYQISVDYKKPAIPESGEGSLYYIVLYWIEAFAVALILSFATFKLVKKWKP